MTRSGKKTGTLKKRRGMVSTVVGDSINTIKTTFDFNFDLNYEHININIEVKRSFEFTKLLFDYL